jgi:serine/threonine-protein kinase
MVLLGQVAQALAAVHAAGVVHRDVKPENVLVQWRGDAPHPLLTDFGLAGAAAGPSDLTRLSQLLGTPAYIAPELVAGRSATAATDVYALGVMAYELLAGERPFAAPNTAALLRAHLDTEPVRPARLADPVWELLRAMLAKPPADRPTAAAAAGELARLRRREQLPPPVPPPPPTAPTAGTGGSYPPPPPAAASLTGTGQGQAAAQPTTGASRPVPASPAPAPPRRRRAPLVLAVVTVTLLGAGAGLWFGRPDGTTEPPPAPTAPTPRFQELAVTATSPSAGTIQLNFPDTSGTPGFDSYVIFRSHDRGWEQIARVPAGGDVPPYVVPQVDESTDYCWRVAALVESHEPAPSVTAEPACQKADGSHGAPTEAP